MNIIKKIILHTIMVLLLAQSISAQQTAHHLKTEATISVDYQYLLFQPSNKENAENGLLPLIVFLHGAGERGDSIDLVKMHGPPKIVESDPNFPFMVLSPQCPAGDWWQPAALDALVAEIVKTHPVDPNRVYLTGLSMGGYGTWDLALYNPSRYAAIAPICGASEINSYVVGKLKGKPIWVFHGALDPVIPIGNSVRMVRALKAQGDKPLFTVYPEAEHDSWTAAYSNPKLYAWFLNHRL